MTKIGQSPRHEAAGWFARLRSDRISRADRMRFLDWLNEDQAHSAAYGECQAAWELAGASAGDDEILRLRQEALAFAPIRRFRSWHAAGALAAAVALFLFLGIGLFVTEPLQTNAPSPQLAEADGPKVLRTAIGERSAVTLRDGSVVELNTDSLALVGYSDERRTVRLVRGQALFDVATDGARPFVVEAAGKRITALGTIFDVRVDPAKMQVTLIEGSVRVEPVEGDGPAMSVSARTLKPGEKLIARRDEPLVVLPADVQKQVGWRSGRLVFSDEPLGEVVAEINRYSTRQVVLSDAGLAELRVSGVFRVGSMPGFVAALDAGFPVNAEHRPSEVVLRWDPGPSGADG